MASTQPDLGLAHRGYQYQDPVTAYFFALALVHSYDSITVDRKRFEDDRFDDLAVYSDSGHVLQQVKFGVQPIRPFEIKDLSTNQKDLRIDTLVRTYKSDGNDAADEYRLCATWTSPDDPILIGMLEPITAEPSFERHSTKHYRLRTDIIWPPNGGVPMHRDWVKDGGVSQRQLLVG